MTTSPMHEAASNAAQGAPGAAACLVFLARALRDFGDGFVAILLPVYLSALGYGALETGLVATVALFGSALMTLAIGLVGGRVHLRLMLIGASGLMAATGLAYAASHHLTVILVVAFIGTINPSAGSVSIFVPLEHALIAGASAPAKRTATFATYSLIGALAAAAGALAAAAPQWLEAAGLTPTGALRGMFLAYAALGLAGGLVYGLIPHVPGKPEDAGQAGLGPSRGIVYRLAALFSLDAFAGGFAVNALMALWLFSRFDLSLASAALFFFWSGVLSAFSFPVAALIARRIGLVNTMVFTHIPSSVCLILAALSPRLDIALGLLLLRSALSQMDVPTRSSYVMAVVTPPERPAAASVTSVPRSLAAAASPALAGALFAAGYHALPLILCGALKILYDILLLIAFRHVKPMEER